MRRYVTYSTDVDVDVDIEELLADLTDAELAEYGLMRIGERPLAAAVARAGSQPYEPVSSLQDHIYAVYACRKPEAKAS